ncbi:MAG: DNA polymerase III subunit delta [Rickettsiales bacterium]
MKITAKQITSFIENPQNSCGSVLIYGVDNGLVRDRSRSIIKSVLGSMAEDSFAKSEIAASDLSSDPAKLYDELSAVSMMCDKRVIVVYDATDKITKIIEEAENYLNKDTFLIITAGELQARSSLRGFFEKSKTLASLACYRDEAKDVQSVIRQKFQEAGIKYDNETLNYLVSQLGNDRYVTYQELEKIALYAADTKEINLNDVKLLVDYNQTTQLDDIVNSVADRNLKNLEEKLTQHLKEGTQPIMYIRSMQRYFNKLYSIRLNMKENQQTARTAVAALRPPVFFKQQPILIRHADSWTLDNITNAIKILIGAELDCKTSDIPAIEASSRKLMKITQIR